jgi:hypothetical protein
MKSIIVALVLMGQQSGLDPEPTQYPPPYPPMGPGVQMPVIRPPTRCANGFCQDRDTGMWYEAYPLPRANRFWSPENSPRDRRLYDEYCVWSRRC